MVGDPVSCDTLAADSGVLNYPILLTDWDTLPDFCDLDSDGDGLFDLLEAGLSLGLDLNLDGVLDTSAILSINLTGC